MTGCRVVMTVEYRKDLFPLLPGHLARLQDFGVTTSLNSSHWTVSRDDTSYSGPLPLLMILRICFPWVIDNEILGWKLTVSTSLLGTHGPAHL